MSKITRGEKGEQAVADVLSSIKEYHILLNDITFVNARSGMSHQIDHILIHPSGVFLIETKNYYGTVTVEDNDWYKVIRGKKIRITSPLSQNKSHVISLYRATKGAVSAIGVVVYVKNNAPYLPDENVINLKDLLLFIECCPYPKNYQSKDIDALAKTIIEASSYVSHEEHVENIGYLKQVKKEEQAEMAYAIETRKCPRCGTWMKRKGSVRYCPRCHYGFSL